MIFVVEWLTSCEGEERLEKGYDVFLVEWLSLK